MTDEPDDFTTCDRCRTVRPLDEGECPTCQRDRELLRERFGSLAISATARDKERRGWRRRQRGAAGATNDGHDLPPDQSRKRPLI